MDCKLYEDIDKEKYLEYDVYEISPPSSPEYKDIEKSPKSLITSILLKSKWFDNYEYKNDTDNYYYVCSLCGEYVYYYARDEHRQSHESKCCIIL